MLPPLIIEQIRKREEEERHRRDPQPAIELPLYAPRKPAEDSATDPDSERGVVIIDLM